MIGTEVLREQGRRLSGAILRGVISGYNRAGMMLTVQARLRDNERQGDIEVFHPAGISTAPAPSSKCEALFLALGAGASKRVALIVGDRKYHVKAEEGQLVLFDPDSGDSKIILDKDGITLECKKITLKSDEIKLDSDLVQVKRSGGFKTVSAVGDKDTGGDFNLEP